LLIARNELAEAELLLRAAQPTLEFLNDFMFFAPMWWGWAKLRSAQGDHQRAYAWYERILKRWKTTEDTLLILPILLDGIEYYADTGNLVRARQWLAELQALVRVTDNPVGIGALLEARGVVDAARNVTVAAAIQSLRQAVEAWSKLKRPYHQALASQRLAQLLLAWEARKTGAAGRATRAEAEMLLNWATTTYERLHIPTALQAVRALRASTHLEALSKCRSTLRTRQSLPGLTQRETQVLLQLVAGRTNREIAAALTISVRTVDRHVGQILSKLGCETRTQAAAYAIAKGWANNQVPS
jgi:DNA-binding CsgD family transcriptional regulator